MKTRTLKYHESFDATAEHLFGVLLRPSAIRKWWSASSAIVVPEQGGRYAVAWGEDEDAPEYVTVTSIRTLDAPSHFGLADHYYYGRPGPLPFEARIEIDFDLEAGEAGTRLQVTQRGFPAGPEADEFYAACVKGWRDVFAGIRAYLASDPG